MSTSVAPRPPSTTPPEPQPRRSLRRRFSAGHVVLVVVALIAGLANYAVLTSGQPQLEVLVAARDLPAGSVLSAGDIETMTIVLDGPVRDSFVTRGESLEGRVLVADLAAGTPLRLDDVREAAGSDGLRRMSLPVDRELAVGGTIRRGDRVDVLLADDGTAHYLVVNADVVAVAEASDSPLQGMGGYYVTVTVDAPAARCLAAGLTTGQVTVVLSTGAEAATVDGCTADGRLVPMVAAEPFPSDEGGGTSSTGANDDDGTGPGGQP